MFDAQWVRKQERNYPGIISAVTDKFLESAGIIVQGDAKRLVPVDTGNLRGSILRERKGLTEEVGTNVEYAEYVEYGTRNMKEQPYLRPAIDTNRKGLMQLLRKLLVMEIESGRN